MTVFGSSALAASMAAIARSKRSLIELGSRRMSESLAHLVAAVEAALADSSLADDHARTEAFRPAMAALLADPDALPAWAYEPFEGGAVGNLVHVDPESRFHILAVVFPE